MMDYERYNRIIRYALAVSLVALAAITLCLEIFLCVPHDQRAVHRSRHIAQAKIHTPATVVILPPVQQSLPPRAIPLKKGEKSLDKKRRVATAPKRSSQARPRSKNDIIIDVAEKTGVNARLIDAILTVESQKGKFVGKKKMAGKIPKKQRKPLFTICRNLGYHPNEVPLAPHGEMGPAQFKPTTWLGLKEKIGSVAEKPPDPWNFRDAAIAAALHLKELGAHENEDIAIMKYNAGSNWHLNGRPYLLKVRAAKQRSNI